MPQKNPLFFSHNIITRALLYPALLTIMRQL
jgi:hypothetical protein